jgi:RHS repeat-associated protein
VLTKHVHYTYDVYDRLIGKQLDPTGGGTYTSAQWFAYDDNSDAPASAGSDTSNIVFAFNGGGTMTHRLLNGPAVDQPLADENGSGTVSWMLPDDQGTIRDVAQYNAGTNTTSIVDHLKFDGFGNITAQSNSASQPLFAYTGRLSDSDTGLQYNRARWYDPKDGRFVSEDPTGFGGGDINLSRYVHNAPTDFVDPAGLEGKGGRMKPPGPGGYTPPFPGPVDLRPHSGSGGQKPPTSTAPGPPPAPSPDSIPPLDPNQRSGGQDYGGSSKPPHSGPVPPSSGRKPKSDQMGPVGSGGEGPIRLDTKPTGYPQNGPPPNRLAFEGDFGPITGRGEVVGSGAPSGGVDYEAIIATQNMADAVNKAIIDAARFVLGFGRPSQPAPHSSGGSNP